MPTIKLDIPDDIYRQIADRNIYQDVLTAVARFYEQEALISREKARQWSGSQTALDLETPATTAKPGRFVIYTDGGCSGNPGPGGWGTIVHDLGSGEKEELSGGKPRTTNNQMEMQAVIEGLQRTPPGSTVRVVADSEYVVKGMTQWLPNWLRRNWQTASKTPVKNKELWQEMYRLSQARKVSWDWVKGHANHPENERCDQLAVAAYQRYL